MAYFESVEVGLGKDLDSTVVTQEQIDNYRLAVDDPDAAFPGIAPRADVFRSEDKYGGCMGRVNARFIREYYNPPIPGKRIYFTGGIADKYVLRGLPYCVLQVTAVDEDERLIEKTTMHEMVRTKAVGEKWARKVAEEKGLDTLSI
jgi:hypothetical protein